MCLRLVPFAGQALQLEQEHPDRLVGRRLLHLFDKERAGAVKIARAHQFIGVSHWELLI